MEALGLFTTPIFSFVSAENPGLDVELADRMVRESERAPGIARGNTGGWRSVPDLSRRPEPCFQELMRRTVSSVQSALFEIVRAQDAEISMYYRYSIQAWAVVMRDGQHAALHDHAEAHFSAVYYPAIGNADLEQHPGSGRLSFVDPRRGGTVVSGVELFPSQFSLDPRVGQMVVFPGWLQHFVEPYRGTKPRVSISCNVRLEADLREAPAG